MKYLLPVNKTSVIAKRIGDTKETAEPCSIPGVGRQESFGIYTSGDTVDKRHASNKYCFPYLMAAYFCSSNYNSLVLLSYDPPFVSKYLKMTFNLSFVCMHTTRILFFNYTNTGTFKRL